MTAYNDPLWQTLQSFELDQVDAELSFTRRLARENGWHRDFAARVVAEYRRFLWLAMRAGHPVTPSDEVDQAWHLHLVYTESYWEDLCGKVLGRPLHHGPTKGGQAEDDKYHDWYARTLASYEAAFGEAPPAAIWPPPARRFAREARFRRVNLAAHWVISKSHWLPGVAAALLLAALGAGLALLGKPPLDETLRADLVTYFFVAVAVVVLLGVVTGNKHRRGRRRGGRDGHHGGCGGSGGGCGSSSGCGNNDGGSSGCGSSGCGGGCGGGGD